MPEVRTDWDSPAIECCGVIFEHHENYDECPICGELFDWVEALGCWNEEDYTREETASFAEEDYGEQLDFLNSIKFRKEYSEDYNPFYFDSRPWGQSLAIPPSQHLCGGGSNQRVSKRKDPLFVEIPDDTI